MKSIATEDRTDVLGENPKGDRHGGVPQLHCVVIGRALFADLRIREHYSEPEVAGQHLKVVLDGGTPTAICLARFGSMVVNGKSFIKPDRCPLKKGDVIKLGRRVEIHVDGVPQKDGDLLILRVMNEACDEGHYGFRLVEAQPLTVNRDAALGFSAFKGMEWRELSHDGTTWRLLKLVGRGVFGLFRHKRGSV